ncbi:MAG: cytochrome P450 [Hyphomicrobiaceae bacterium]
MTERKPVTDWLTDWDHMAPAWTEDPYPIWDKIRTSACPIAHTERYGGVYLPTTFADMQTIAYDPESFSSRQVVVRERQPEDAGGAPPITTDPPKHRLSRMRIMPPFSGHEIKKLMPRTREICNQLIDQFADNGRFDGAVDYAQNIPVHVIAHMLGLPDTDADRFRGWIQQILVDGIADDEAMHDGLHDITQYFYEHLEARRAQPGDDLISYLAQQTYEDGEPFKETHILGSLRLILIAGIDTTWSAIGASIWHLAKNPRDRERLVAEPELMRSAVEEFLRAYAPVTMARLIAKDTTVNGCPMKAGEMLLLPFPAANRDPDQFDDADRVILDRENNRHVAFGMGIHRCVGMHLARMEITIALEELLKRVPVFELAGETTWSQGAIRGPRTLPLSFPTQ